MSVKPDTDVQTHLVTVLQRLSDTEVGEGLALRLSVLGEDGNVIGTHSLPVERTSLSCGSHPSNDVVISDSPSVSRFHCEIRRRESGFVVTDIKSRNGTFVDGVRVVEGWVRHGSIVQLGERFVRVEWFTPASPARVSDRVRFGELAGRSRVMREVFTALERAAASVSTVLLEGETGTGKGAAARAIHDHGARARGRFVVVDCSAIPKHLAESELFGHERGAFSGADARRVGAFEAASGGTLFLDELGELPTELQPKLLRVLEERCVRPLGTTESRPVDVRVVAATHRNLREDVNEGRFRPDLYYRLAVIRVTLPPLRQRPEDLPLVVESLLERMPFSEDETTEVVSRSYFKRLASHAWPGNVRELRNHLERTILLGDVGIADTVDPHAEDDSPMTMNGLEFGEARREALERFELQYLKQLLNRTGGRTVEAAREAGLNRVYLYKLLRKHGLR